MASVNNITGDEIRSKGVTTDAYRDSWERVFGKKSIPPESYTITITEVVNNGETTYEGRVTEFPNISSFESTSEEAYKLVIDAIVTLTKIANETNVDLPLPGS